MSANKRVVMKNKIVKTLLLLLIAATLVVLVSCSGREETAPSEPKPFILSDEFVTGEEAAIAALKECAKRSNKFEYASIIFEMNGKFYYSDPETSGHADKVVGIQLRYPKSSKPYAIVHTHPNADRDWISPADVKYSRKNDIRLYVLTMKSGVIITFVPGETRLIPHSLGDPYSMGEFVTKIE